MSSLDMDHYMANAEAFDALSDDDKAKVFAGQSIEGTPPEDGEAEAAEGEAATDEQSEILAKDGKHTIPFSERESARERAAELEQIARDQAALIESLRQQQTAAPQDRQQDDAPAAVEAIDVQALEKSYIEAMMEGDTDKALEIRAQVNAEIARQAEAVATAKLEQRNAAAVAETAAQAAQRLLEDTASRMIQDHPYLDSSSKDSNPEAIKDVVEWRDFYIAKGADPVAALQSAVAKVTPVYSKQVASQPPANTNAAARAAEVIANAKAKAPASLSDIPAGSPSPHDEVATIRDMDGLALMNRFSGKSADEIMGVLSKVI